MTMDISNEPVVIDDADDNDDDDDVEIIEVTNCSKSDGPSSSIGISSSRGSDNPRDTTRKLPPYSQSKNKKLPIVVNGYYKPAFNYCRLITQVLATSPEKKATGVQICDKIAKKYPYYEYLIDVDWRASIYCSLRNRKKFFTVVGIDKNEFIWSFNPTYEQYIMDRWAPKVSHSKLPAQKLSSLVQCNKPWLSNTSPQQFKPPTSNECSSISSSTSLADSSVPTSPVIVFSGSLITASPLDTSMNNFQNPSADTSMSNFQNPSADTSMSNFQNPSADCVNHEVLEKDPLDPDLTIVESTPITSSVSGVEDDFQNLESRISFNGGHSSLNPTSTQISSKKSNIPYNKDFSLENLNSKHIIQNEEIMYRVNFSKEHQSIGKFRLHCTVCDDHVGTSGTVCQRRARLHSFLGVLVCSKCYELTSALVDYGCMWCSNWQNKDGRIIRCVSCRKVCCQSCLERNFGKSWCETMVGRTDWQCFLCDTKQIWPHRAIAYFLFRHYRDIKRKKIVMSKPKKALTPSQIRFFIQDRSTCCKSTITEESLLKSATLTMSDLGTPAAAVASLATNSATLSNSNSSVHNTVPSQPSFFTLGEKSPKYIYFQSSSGVPSVTLNTGTQYIHNVFPDKNYVVDKTTANPSNSAVNTSTMTNNFLYSQSPSPKFSNQTPENNSSIVPMQPPPYSSYPNQLPPPYSAIDVHVTPCNTLSNNFVKEPELINSMPTNRNVPSKSVETNNLNIIVTSTSEILGVEAEEPIIIPDVDLPEELKIQEEKVIAVPIMSAKERIERRPMPKSKKQSLLKTVLMNESIESMKRHLQQQQSEPNVLAEKNESCGVVSQKRVARDDKNIEEPILKSIIETATERLLSLQRNPNVSSNQGDNSEETRIDSNFYIDLCDEESASGLEGNSQTNSDIIEPSFASPKIKIKTLKELQDPEVFNVDPNNSKHQAIQKESDCVNQQHEVEKQEPNKNSVTDKTEVNITDLKQGIIEASRTLINTQKQFKELAKVISSNLVYKPYHAVDLITKFHDILKTCRQELHKIDIDVKHKFDHLIPNTKTDSILQSGKINTDALNPSACTVKQKKKKKGKKSRRKSSDSVIQPNTVCGKDFTAKEFQENQTDLFPDNPGLDENDRSPIKTERVLLHFNPLGKKEILGSPDVTEEDLRRIPNTWGLSPQTSLDDSNQKSSPSHNQVYMEELRRRQYLARKVAWKKKNIWLNCRRKKKKLKKKLMPDNANGPLMYNEQGSLIKKRPYKKRKKILVGSDDDVDDDDNDITYKPNNIYYPKRNYTKMRKSNEMSIPLRLSARRHPSTKALVAQLTNFEPRVVTHEIKPCSVVLHRLDPKMLQILEQGFYRHN